MIFGIQPNELSEQMDKKLNRLKRWMENDNKSFQHTTEDRSVEETSFDADDHSWDGGEPV